MGYGRRLLFGQLIPFLVLLCAIASLALAPLHAQVKGELFDPTGDSLGANGTADLVSASITVLGPNLTIEVRYAPGTFDPAGTAAQFLLDTDMSVATGSPGTGNNCAPPDNALIGVDWAVQLRSFAGTVQILQALGGCNAFAGVANTLTIEEVADGMNLTLPRSLIGNDDGRLHFKVASSTQLTAGGQFSLIQDRMSDPGLPVGVVGGLPDTTPCVRDDDTACLLDDRFEVEVTMWNFATPPVRFAGRIQTYMGASSETDQSVSWYSFQDGNVEVFVKMVDACSNPSFESFWLFAAGATNAETEILVRDTATGTIQRLHNPRAALFEAVANTQAFQDCP